MFASALREAATNYSKSLDESATITVDERRLEHRLDAAAQIAERLASGGSRDEAWSRFNLLALLEHDDSTVGLRLRAIIATVGEVE